MSKHHRRKRQLSERANIILGFHKDIWRPIVEVKHHNSIDLGSDAHAGIFVFRGRAYLLSCSGWCRRSNQRREIEAHSYCNIPAQPPFCTIGSRHQPLDLRFLLSPNSPRIFKAGTPICSSVRLPGTVATNHQKSITCSLTTHLVPKRS